MAGVQSVRVLVIDNHPPCEDPVTDFLRRWGNEVRTVFGGSLPLGESREFAPELVMIHCGTAEFDGLSLVKRLRRRQSFGSIPLVAVSSDGADESRRAGIAAGFDQWLVRPVTHADLAHMLDGVRGIISMPGGLAQRTTKQVELFDALQRERDKQDP